MNKKVIYVAFILVAALAGLVALSYVSSRVKVTVVAPDNAEVLVYKSTSNEGEIAYEVNNPIIRTSGKTEKKLKKDTYIYVVKGISQDYETVEKIIGIDSPTIIKPDLVYTLQKRKQIAEQEKSNVEKLMYEEYPLAMQQYVVNKMTTSKDGKWIGFELQPKNSTFDSVLAIVERNNNSLTLATKVPEIVLSSVVYTNIPEDVIIETNELITYLAQD